MSSYVPIAVPTFFYLNYFLFLNAESSVWATYARFGGSPTHGTLPSFLAARASALSFSCALINAGASTGQSGTAAPSTASLQNSDVDTWWIALILEPHSLSHTMGIRCSLLPFARGTEPRVRTCGASRAHDLI